MDEILKSGVRAVKLLQLRNSFQALGICLDSIGDEQIEAVLHLLQCSYAAAGRRLPDAHQKLVRMATIYPLKPSPAPRS